MAEQKTAKEAIAEETAKVVKVTKQGFDLKARLEGRGLRRATITLYLDEDKGVELGDAYDVKNNLGQVTRRARSGVIGELDEVQSGLDLLHETNRAAILKINDDQPEIAEEKRRKIIDAAQPLIDAGEARIAELTQKRDEMIADLAKTGLVVQLRAVPPVIEKDMHRRAKATLGITEKSVPADRAEEVSIAGMAHLLTVVVQSITDNATETVNDGLTYEDAIALMDLLPPSQWARLDNKVHEVQYTDAISLQIEQQEDFS